MERKALGKGLGALIPGAGGREDHSGPREIPLERISFNPYQPRKGYDDEGLEDLVRSVRIHGILQPIVVRAKGENNYELVAGERRVRAASAAGLTRIPAVIKELTNQQSLEVALIENLQREDITPVEAALAYRRLVDDFGLSQEDIGFRLGKSRSAVANTLRLLNLPDEIRDSIARGEITEGHGRALLSVEDSQRQADIWREVIERGLSVRDTEQLCRQERDDPPAAPSVSRETSAPERDDPMIAHLEEQLRRRLGTKVSISKLSRGGRIEIEFYSEDDLDRIVTLILPLE